jgi:hypothetical protein
MTGQCCKGGTATSRLARRIYAAIASAVPGAMLVLLPKCPLCLAAWLTAATGVGFTATGAAWLRGSAVTLGVAAVALALLSIARRQGFARVSVHVPKPGAARR